MVSLRYTRGFLFMFGAKPPSSPSTTDSFKFSQLFFQRGLYFANSNGFYVFRISNDIPENQTVIRMFSAF